MLRIITAVIAITLMSGAAHAVPDDATSENDAIMLEENTLPGGNEPSPSMGAEPNAAGATDFEAQELDEEKNY